MKKRKIELTENGKAVLVTAPISLFAFEVLAHGGTIGFALAAASTFVAARHGSDIKNAGERLLRGLVTSRGQREMEEIPTDEQVEAFIREHGLELPTEEQVDEYEQAARGAQRRGRGEPLDLDDEMDLQAPPKPRGLFLFSEVLQHFTPTLDKIYLATLPDGTSIFCDYKALCHVALAGATDAGKSSIMRMLVAQLCYVGAKVLILNPHWTSYVLDKQEDWTPILPYLFDDPMQTRKYDKIDYYLNYLANTTVPQRLERFAHSKPTGKPIFVVIDELPAIVKWGKKNGKDIPGYLDTILKEGRKVGVYLISAAQDFLVDTIGGTGAVRDCYRTAYSVGGDDTTTNKLLGKIKVDRPLGKGVVLLRNASNDLCKEAVVALVPYVDNESLYLLLGPSTYVPDVVTGELEDFELEDAKAQTTDSAQIAPLTEVSNDKPSVKPNIDKQLRSDDLHIDTLTQAWNAGINTVSGIEKFFKMSHGEAYKAYNRVKALSKESVSEE